MKLVIVYLVNISLFIILKLIKYKKLITRKYKLVLLIDVLPFCYN